LSISRAPVANSSASYLAPVRMLRSARLLIRLARFVAREAALLARVRVQLSRERRPTAWRSVGEGAACARKHSAVTNKRAAR
jgi:hypothetical protein